MFYQLSKFYNILLYKNIYVIMIIIKIRHKKKYRCCFRIIFNVHIENIV